MKRQPFPLGKVATLGIGLGLFYLWWKMKYGSQQSQFPVQAISSTIAGAEGSSIAGVKQITGTVASATTASSAGWSTIQKDFHWG